MYGLYSKKIIILLLSLLILGCSTTKKDDVVEVEEVITMTTLFPGERESFVYVDTESNLDLVKNLALTIGLKKSDLKPIEKSRELYLGTGYDLSKGYDLLLIGEYSKSLYEIGLFFSFSWKKVWDGSYYYWQNSSGIKLSIVNGHKILISTGDITPLIESIKNGLQITPPNHDMLLHIPDMEDGFLKEATGGFIKKGVNELILKVDHDEGKYNIVGDFGLGSDRMARGFSTLLKLFLKLYFSQSDDPEISLLSKNMLISYNEKRVNIENITLSEKKIIEILNNLLVNDGEADK